VPATKVVEALLQYGAADATLTTRPAQQHCRQRGEELPSANFGLIVALGAGSTACVKGKAQGKAPAAAQEARAGAKGGDTEAEEALQVERVELRPAGSRRGPLDAPSAWLGGGTRAWAKRRSKITLIIICWVLR